MQTGTTLFQLRADHNGLFDGSNVGVAIARAVNATPLPDGAGVTLAEGAVEVARHKMLDELQAFTLEASITPSRIGPDRQNILEGQSPAVSLHLSPEGRLVGGVHVDGAWTEVDSGAVVLEANRPARVRFTRDDAGNIQLFIDDAAVGAKPAQGTVQKTGELGLLIGAGITGPGLAFSGEVKAMSLFQGAVPSDFLSTRLQKAQALETSVSQILKRVRVVMVPDESRARLQPIKDIMKAAGVDRLSDLTTLRLTRKTVMTPGTVMVSARKSVRPEIDWADLANKFRAAAVTERRTMLALSLANQNSRPMLEAAEQVDLVRVNPLDPDLSRINPGSVDVDSEPVVLDPGAVRIDPRLVRTDPGSVRIDPRVVRPEPGIPRMDPGSVIVNRGVGAGGAASRRPGTALARARLRRAGFAGHTVGELVRLESDRLKVDRTVLDRIADRNPARWPATTAPAYDLLALKTIPVNSAVIIAATLDLTDTQLVVEPNVKTLYIIADTVICGNNAAITWRRPGGETPARADDPNLNGRGWSGKHTKPDSRDGLDGESGRAGAEGLSGAPGVNAPHLEMWVKHMTGMPNLDLNGEDGRVGGRGQRGGNGGHGANGAGGERIWAFGWHCTADPGDGGDGGNGGAGGAGGRGGNGGNGGKITIGVLEDTLESTVTSRAFKIKNQAAPAGRGGPGGAGGAGGGGGRSGVGDTCKDAEHGHAGAQGQPGAQGPDGFTPGADGFVEFFEFNEDAWDDLLTRPWLTEISPVQAFPGDRLTLRGSRFSSNDVVFFGGAQQAHTIDADESVSLTVPLTASGGEKAIFIRRSDGTESNRISVQVKPQLEPLTSALNPGSKVTLSGRAFVSGAAVLTDGAANKATVESATQISFEMPGTGGTGAAGATVTVQVRNPDGLVSNLRTAQIPRILEIPFRFGQHNLPFGNFKDGIPDWSTYEETFGKAEVWHEQLDPVFGHPILTAAYFAFYQHFLKGEDNGGLATGFCTSLSSLVADRFWQGLNDTITITKPSVHKLLTAVHGRLLTRESLIHFHDQGRQGVARVEQSYREIEATFLRGCDRSNAPLVFFIPSGAAWDAGYFDKLGKSHCVMPWRFKYPEGREPQLSPDGSSTLTDPDGVEMFVWDCNNPASSNCRFAFRRVDGQIHFEYFDDKAAAPTFRSQDGITLGMMTNGSYLHADHDLPFSGPFGLTTFIIDFLLSPADLQVTDESGARTGNFGGALLAEIPNSRPCYLAPGCYMLPDNTALTRRIVGSGAGTYAYHSIMPSGGSVVLENVATAPGQEDVLAVSADGNQIRFTPAVEKSFNLTLARTVGSQARAISIQGAGGGPAADVDLALSPDLSLLRLGNRGAGRNVEVRAFSIDRATNAPANRQFAAVSLPANHDLTVVVTNWANLDASVETLPFQ